MGTLPPNMGALTRANTPPPANVAAIPQGIEPYLQSIHGLTPGPAVTPPPAQFSAIPQGLEPYLQSLFQGL